MCDAGGGVTVLFFIMVGGQKLKIGIDGGQKKKKAKLVKIPPRLINNDRPLNLLTYASL